MPLGERLSRQRRLHPLGPRPGRDRFKRDLPEAGAQAHGNLCNVYMTSMRGGLKCAKSPHVASELMWGVGVGEKELIGTLARGGLLGESLWRGLLWSFMTLFLLVLVPSCWESRLALVRF